MYTIINKKSGFTLIETLVYVAGIIILLVVIFSFISSTYNWYRTATIGSRIDAIGTILSDHLSKNIHSGQSIDSPNTLFGTTTGRLSIVALVNAVNVTKKYSIINGRITYSENGGISDYLTPTDVTVTKLYFTNMTNAISEAVRFEVELSYMAKNGTSTRTYSSVAILKNSY